MGVNSLWTVLGPTARPVRLEALSRKKLAVDASIWIYQFLKAVRDNEGNALPHSHIIGFFRRICKLLYFGILPIFVFDGGAPVLKRETINERKQRRQGKSESVRDVAQKLFAIQVQRKLGKSNMEPSTKKATPSDFNFEGSDMVYFEDLPMNQQTSERPPSPAPAEEKRFLKKDEFHLPELKEFTVSKKDGRVMAKEEFDSSLAEFDYVDGIDINSVDPKSKEFLDLPIASQYMILSHLRLKSRLRMGYRKEQLEALFPNSMDFSRFQIQQVQKRNFYTQKLMTVAGMDEEIGNVTRRIAGDSDRKYMLAKNDDGYTLALGNGAESDNPIVLDEDGQEVKNAFSPKPLIEYASQLEGRNKAVTTSKEEEVPENPNQIDVKSDSDSDSEFEDVILNEERPESIEEQNFQKALIESMYDQYEEPSLGPDSASNLTLDRNNAQPEAVSLDSEEDDDLGSSIFFPTKKEQGATIDGSSSSLNSAKNVLNNLVTNNDNIVEEEESAPLGRSFLFPMDRPSKANNIRQDNRQQEAKATVNAPQKKDTLITKRERISEAQVSQRKKVLDKSEPLSDDASSPEIQEAKEVPDWFKHDINQADQIHSQSFLPTQTNLQHKYKEDEEAGLISWNDAKELLGGEEEDIEPVAYENDDLQEVSAADFESNRVESSSQSKPVEVEKTAGQKRQAEVLDYDFEEEDEDELVQQLRIEEDDHETFKTHIREAHEISLASIDTSINNEQLLQEKLQKAKRDSDEVTQTMINDVQELLRRFGIPYITAPMEAEAQCAELLKLKLVDGIITDDSDCFLFGGDKVYKNMFNQKQFVECYIMNEIEAKVGLNQEKMIEMALLLGSDYTTGIKGIGPVLAMEILAEFGSLKGFKSWFDETTKTTAGIKSQANATGLRKTLVGRVNSGKLYLPDSFPEKIVVSAYTTPEVDDDKTEFKWGVPSLDEIRSYLMYNVNWSQAKVDEVMIPLIRDMNKRKSEGVQSTIGEFFPQEFIQARKDLAIGKRMKSAASKLNKRKKTD